MRSNNEIIQLERDREMIGILAAATTILTGPLLLTVAFTSSSCESDSEREIAKGNKAVAAWQSSLLSSPFPELNLTSA